MYQLKISNLQASWNTETGSTLEERRAPKGRYWGACIGPGWLAGNGQSASAVAGDAGGYTAVNESTSAFAGPGHDVVLLRGTNGGDLLVPQGTIVLLDGTECQPTVEAVRAAAELRTAHVILMTDPCELVIPPPRRAPLSFRLDDDTAATANAEYIPFAGRRTFNLQLQAKTAAATYAISGVNVAGTAYKATELATGSVVAGQVAGITVSDIDAELILLDLAAGGGGTIWYAWDASGEMNR